MFLKVGVLFAVGDSKAECTLKCVQSIGTIEFRSHSRQFLFAFLLFVQ